MEILAILPTILSMLLLYLMKKPVLALRYSCGFSIILLLYQTSLLSKPLTSQQSFLMRLEALLEVLKGWLFAFNTNELLQILSMLWGLSCLSALLGILMSNGAIEGLTKRLLLQIKTEKQAGFLVCFLGLLFHQGGTISAMVVGFTSLLLTKKRGMTRAKHAFLLDATASPVAVLIPSSPWFYLISLGLIGTLPILKDEQHTWSFVISSIRFQFYGIFATISAFVIASHPRFLKHLTLYQPESIDIQKTGESKDDQVIDEQYRQDQTSILYQTHRFNTQAVGLIDLFLPLCSFFISLFFLRATLGLWSFALASTLALCLALFFSWYRGFELKALFGNWLHLLKKLGIGGQLLLLAMLQSFLSQKLGLNALLISLIGNTMPRVLLPLLCAGLGFLASFSTGTALGSLSLLSSALLQLAWHVDTNPIFLQLCFATLLGACVCGDHCSPISDTTIASSFFSDCPLKTHVRTQLPIALFCLGLSVSIASLMLYFI